jgi:hypothetical protein
MTRDKNIIETAKILNNLQFYFALKIFTTQEISENVFRVNPSGKTKIAHTFRKIFHKEKRFLHLPFYIYLALVYIYIYI